MRSPLAPQLGQEAASPLHGVWWQVLMPGSLVLANGQPGYEIVHTAETLAEATAHVRAIPGGLIVINCVVFVNPRMSAPPPN